MIFFRRSPEYDPNTKKTLELRLQLWTSGWRGALVLVVLVGTVLGLWKGAEMYNELKLWRARNLITESDTAREQGDFTEASSKLRQATALLQRHPLTLRAVARYQTEMHDLAALDTYVELMKTGQATTEDKVAFGAQAFRLGRPELAAKALEQLTALPVVKDTAAVLALQAEQSAWQGHWAEALKLARQACVSPGNDQDHAHAQSVLARLLLRPPAPVQDAGDALPSEGMGILTTLALRQDSTGIESQELLVSLAQEPRTAALFSHRDFAAVMAAAERHPHAGPALKVGVWNLRLAAEPAKRAEVTKEFFDHFKDVSSPALRLEAARWLNLKRMHRQALELVGTSRLESKDWFLLYLDATAGLGDWEDVLVTLSANNQNIPLIPGLRDLFKLRAELETGRHPDLTDAWRDIRVEVRNESAADQLYVAGYAQQIGFSAESARLYRQLLERDKGILEVNDKLSRPRRLACYTGLLATGAAAMTMEELRTLMGGFAAEFPELDEVQNDNAYLQLLCSADLERAESTAQRLVQAKPESLAYRTTLALSGLRRHQFAKAAAVYDGWSIDWNTAQDRYKAVYAAVMRAAGRTAEADSMVARIKAESLRPEERVLAGLP